MRPIHLRADPLLEKVVTLHDLNDGRFAVETRYNVEPLKDQNTALRNANKADWKGENWVASLPMPLWMALRQQGVIQDPKRFKRWLNDPDNAMFRTKTGHL